METIGAVRWQPAQSYELRWRCGVLARAESCNGVAHAIRGGRQKAVDWNCSGHGRYLMSKAVVGGQWQRRTEAASAFNETSAEELIGPSEKLPVQDVVIVGGGIAGLATALGLHRLGIKPLVLEKYDHLRIEGSAIGLWSNAWRALEALGVADSLREKFFKIPGIDLLANDGSLISSLEFDGPSRNIELRAIERKALIQCLREPLPDGSVLYNSEVIGISEVNGGYTEIHCSSGLTVQTKVLIGCDGSGSVVAKWMNMGEVQFSGHMATRGIAVYPDGHTLGPKAKQILGQGVRAGVVPIDPTRAYWFVVFNSTGERVTDVELVREEALNYMRGWPPLLTEAISRSPLDTLSRRGFGDRWMWPMSGTNFAKCGVSLAGDALHPMTPNLGQGGCCALEDAVILARALSKALSATRHSFAPDQDKRMPSQEKEQIEVALRSYINERWPRVLPLAIRSYATGAFMQADSKFWCSIRNRLIPRLLTVDRFADHTFYDCGTLG